MSGGFPKTFIQPPQRIPFRDPLGEVDDPFGDHNSNEVAAMNREFMEDRRLQEAGHND